MQTFNIPEDIRESYKYAIQKSREDRPRYHQWILSEIEILINLINKFDKIFVLGGLGTKLMRAIPTLHNQFLETYEGKDKAELNEELMLVDDDIEVLLEYAISISTATENLNIGVLPSQKDIDDIYAQLNKIKDNVNFWELSAELQPNTNEFDHWLRTSVMQDSINVRGNGFQIHTAEIYKEVFDKHNGFLEQYYGFNANDIYKTIEKLDNLIFSKVANITGSMKSYERFTNWMDEIGEKKVFENMMVTGKNPFEQFGEQNSDITIPNDGNGILHFRLDDINSYSKLFWVIPQTEKEKRIFEKLSLTFKSNANFFNPSKWKAFPLNDTLIKLKPLIKQDDKYYHFSISLAFRNIFEITEDLIKTASAVYYDHSYKGNTKANSRDNFIEIKSKEVFSKINPNAKIYHSLKYDIIENGMDKKTELDLLSISEDTIYIIEVKAGQLSTKHKRGELLSLKDRIKDTIEEGSYQCHRALKYIQENESPTFQYIENNTSNILTIDKSSIKKYYKISITLEHFATISTNLKYLVNSRVLNEEYKWAWIISLYDLMIFADLINNENDFQEYLDYRINLYERNDIVFTDEIDILGFYLEGNFPLGVEKENEVINIVNFRDKINAYYHRTGVGLLNVNKPIKKYKKRQLKARVSLGLKSQQ